MSIFSFIKRNGLILLLGLIGSLIVASPFIYFRFHPEFKGLDMFSAIDDSFYVARVAAATKGEAVNIAFGYGPYADLNIFPSLSENVQGFIGRILSLNPVENNFGGKFYVPLLVYLVTYFGTQGLFVSKISRIILAFGLTLGQDIMYEIVPYSLLQLPNLPTAFTPLARTTNPTFSLLFFLAFWLTAFFYFKSKSKLKLALLSGLAGLLAYINLHYFIYAVVFLGLIVVANIKMKQPKLLLIDVLYSLPILLITLSPFIYNQVFLRKIPYFFEIQQRFGFIGSRSYVFPLLALVLMLFLLWIKKFSKKLEANFMFLVLAILAYIIVINHQIITGIIIENSHWTWLVVPIIYWTIVASVFDLLLVFNRPTRITGLGILLIIYVAFNASLKQYGAYQSGLAGFINRQNIVSLYEWINDNTKKGEVVLANWNISEFLPVYTHAKPLSYNYNVWLPLSNRDLAERYFSYLYLKGIDPDKIAAGLNKQEKIELGHWTRGMYYRNKYDDYDKIPASDWEEYLSWYDIWYRNRIDYWEKQGVVYMIIDSKQDKFTNENQLGMVAKVSDYLIYEIN